jgi:nucleoside-diphosphate-sugar epimerase
MRVLVIGGTGLISTGIVKALLARGHEVTVFNRAKRKSRLPEGVTYLQGDRKDYPAFESAMREIECDAVIDMIAFAPEDTLSAIRAFRGRVRHFIHCSTVCTYGVTLTRLPADEEEPLRPISAYGRNKVACDQALLEAYRDDGFPATIFKPSHTYGPGGPLIRQLGHDPYFIDRLRQGKPVIVAGDGGTLWQSLYCDDAGVGFAAAVGSETTFGQVYNIVGREVITWDEYHRRLASAIGCDIKIVHVPSDLLVAIAPERYRGLNEIFRYHGVYSAAKLREHVPEFRTTVSWEEGVRRNVAWMDDEGLIKNSDEDDLEDRIIAGMDRLREELTAGAGVSPGG